MAYVDNLLASGEQLLRREHQHWFVLIANAAYAIIAWIVAVLVLLATATILRGNDSLSAAGGWVVVFLVIVGLVWFAWQALRWQNEEFVLTTRRVLQSEGVVNKQVIDSSLEKINDAILTESIFGRIFGFGDLEILTASESGISRLRMLRDAGGFKRTMLEAKHELELEVSGAKPMPSPAIRAASAPSADTAGGAAPAAAASPMSADEVTRTLASLADLRDRGAISADEYERKKADILVRL
jgi:uncharacterized membrane protein YdbT with pleckstrin-like domain